MLREENDMLRETANDLSHLAGAALARNETG